MKREPKEDIFHVSEIHPEGIRGFRERDGKISTGVLVPSRNGVPFPADAEIVQGKLCDDQSTLKLTTLYKPKGPGQIATPAYRKNYESIFKTKRADLN